MNKIEPIKEVVLERMYNVSPETLWQAWTDPEMLKKWWGPKNVTIPECEVDLRVPGRFYIVMEAGEGMGEYKGTKWPMEARFTEIVPNSKLSFTAQGWTEGSKGETTIDQSTELTLTKEQDKTKIKIRAAIYKTGPGAEMAVEGMRYGFTEQLEKLNDFLSAENQNKTI